MKNTLLPLWIIFIMCFLISGCINNKDANRESVREAENTAKVALMETPVPKLSYFQERKTIARWAERWDTPNVPCYVYVISHGVIIGYYVSDGKPAASTSYITPPARTKTYSGNPITEELPDIDGTWGDNNPGIRTFLSSGAAVEIGGNLGYIYSDTPLKLEVPLLGK